MFRQQKVTSSNVSKETKDFQFMVIIGGEKPEHNILKKITQTD